MVQGKKYWGNMILGAKEQAYQEMSMNNVARSVAVAGCHDS